MKIGDLAVATGTDAATLRYYEQISLLPKPARMANRYRHYPTQAVQQVAFIRHCRELGLSLTEIERLTTLVQQPDADCDDVNQLLDNHLAQVRTKQAVLARLEAQLLALRGRCAQSRRAGDCGILHDLIKTSGTAICDCPQRGRASEMDLVTMEAPHVMAHPAPL